MIELFDGSEQYFSIFKKPFLLLDVELSSFGGFFALVVFKGHNRVLRFWIYEVDKKNFEVREVTPLEAILDERIQGELEDPRISHFWLSAI